MPPTCRLLLTLLLVVGGARAAAAAAGAPETAPADPFLEGLYTRSLLRTESSLNVFEVEETYDNLRGFGKLVLHSARYGPSVLHARSQAPSPLYLDVQYSLNGTVTGCSASQHERPAGFHLFNGLQQVWPQLAERPHLIGPASLLYLFRRELLDYQPGMSDSTNQTLEQQHRLLLDPRPINVDPHVLFKRAAFEVPRAPLLRQLAAYLEFKAGDRKFFVDFLEVRQFDARRQGSGDTFKMPTVLACTDTNELLYGPLDGLYIKTSEPVGSSVELRHQWQTHPNRKPLHRLVLDHERGFLEFAYDQRWLNVLDLKASILFHVAVEQSPVAQYRDDVLATDRHQSEEVRNSQCSLLSSRQLASYKRPVEKLFTDRHLGFYTGNYASHVYLGVEPNFRGRGRAHELELAYASVEDLPVPVRLLEPTSLDEAKNSWLLGKLWLAAQDTCPDLYSDRVACSNPTLLGFELRRADRSLVGRLDYTDFQWLPAESQVVSSLNLEACPFAQWLELELEVAGYRRQLEAPELDAQVLNRTLDYLAASPALRLVAFKRRPSTYGSERRQYSLRLAEIPELANSFEPVPTGESLFSRLDGGQIDGLSQVYTLQECLAWASQFGQSRSAMYSRAQANCLVYPEEAGEILQLIKKRSSGPNEYQLYSRRLEATQRLGSPVKLFLQEQLDQVNARMELDSRDRKQRLQFLGLRSLTSSAAPDESAELGSTLLGAKLRFSTSAFESAAVLSFRDCSSRCQDEPKCASFAYCMDDKLDQLCQLSPAANLSEPKLTTTDYNCEIHAKDYLHFFEVARERPRQQPSRRLAASSSQQCASLCYLEESCGHFAAHCPASNDGELHCFLWDDQGQPEQQEDQLSSATSCTVYSKSPLAHYRAARFREVGAFAWAGANHLHSARLRGHLNADECARRCTSNSECVSFDLCHLKPDSSKAHQTNHLECTLLSGSVFDEPPLKEQPTATGSANDAAASRCFKCRHYERASAGREARQQAHLVSAFAAFDQQPFIIRLLQFLLKFLACALVGLTLGLTFPALNDYLRLKHEQFQQSRRAAHPHIASAQ